MVPDSWYEVEEIFLVLWVGGEAFRAAAVPKSRAGAIVIACSFLDQDAGEKGELKPTKSCSIELETVQPRKAQKGQTTTSTSIDKPGDDPQPPWSQSSANALSMRS
jgi:hypothetical protein